MKWLFVSLLASVMLACGTTSTVPITGRKQRLLVSDEQILSLSNQQYRQYMAKAKVQPIQPTLHGEKSWSKTCKCGNNLSFS